jgi:hypothetical protein
MLTNQYHFVSILVCVRLYVIRGIVLFSSTIKTTQFTCPMHSDIVQNTSGNCPICEMDLVVLETAISQIMLDQIVIDFLLSEELFCLILLSPHPPTGRL